MSNDQYLEADPVEQFYSYVVDCSEEENALFESQGEVPPSMDALSLYRTQVMQKYIEPFPETHEPEKDVCCYPKPDIRSRSFGGYSATREQILSGNGRNSSGITGESFSEGSTDDDIAKPLYRGYQLLGDSQFVRFSKQILKLKNINRGVSYCVSGQRIQGLHNMLVRKEYKIHKNVILMIGTNDLRHNSAVIRMKESYAKLLELLKEQTQKIVLLTIPPIQNMADSVLHWRTFEAFNKFILSQHNGRQVFVVDFGQHLVGYTGFNGCREYFEEVFASPPERPDLMHLNKKGFLLLKFLLDLHYFQAIQ